MPDGFHKMPEARGHLKLVEPSQTLPSFGIWAAALYLSMVFVPAAMRWCISAPYPIGQYLFVGKGL